MSQQFNLMQLDFSSELTPAERFEQFHQNNPQVYSALKSMTLEMINRGRRQIGIGMLFEVLRWNYYMATNDPNSDFKLNNNYRSHYARLLIAENPEWANMFQLREMRSK
jgi:hypothetical protein